VELLFMAGVGWLLFFPNAPYVLTDFVHLERSPSDSLWIDAVILACFAWTALMVGLFSLYVMHMTWRRALGATGAWLCVIMSLMLASIGVYLGRYLHLNSWDALTHPAQTTTALVNVTSPEHARVSLGLIAFTAFLGLAYMLFYRLELVGESRQRLTG
jgi:uncharacterized membrane protein